MIRTVIVDDEPNSLSSLQYLLKEYCPEVLILGVAEDAEKGFKAIRELQPDLVLLDIEMPYGNAFDLLNRLAPVQFEVIFITAFDNYSINAFRYSALDYLLKPINITELQAAVQKAARQIQLKQIGNRIDNLLTNLSQGQQQPASRKIAFPTAEGYIFVNEDEIVRLEAIRNYTNLYLKDHQKIVISRTLKEFEEMLDEKNFTRIHHSHIINHRYIKRYLRGRGGYIELEDGTRLEVSIRKKEDFLSKFGR